MSNNKSFENAAQLAKSNIVRTIYGDILSTHKATNDQFTPMKYTTLNELHDVYPEEVPRKGEMPKIGYIAIGNKGAKAIPTTDGIATIQEYDHSPEDAGLYGPIPFVVRQANNDLSPQERLRYRMRVPFVKGGISYIAYYLMAIDTDSSPVRAEIRHVENGAIQSRPFEPEDSSYLTPVPREKSNLNVNDPKGDCLVAVKQVSVSLDATDIAEIINACTVMFDNPAYAIISELAICSGVDRVVSGSFGNTTGSYTESIATQICVFTRQFKKLTENDNHLKITVDLGSSEPLLF